MDPFRSGQAEQCRRGCGARRHRRRRHVEREEEGRGFSEPRFFRINPSMIPQHLLQNSEHTPNNGDLCFVHVPQGQQTPAVTENSFLFHFRPQTRVNAAPRRTSSDIENNTRTYRYEQPSAVETENAGRTNVCSICISEFQENQEVRQLRCLHVFHVSCVDSWLTTGGSCPLCRTILN